MSTVVSKEFFLQQYKVNVEGYIVKNIDNENTIVVSKVPLFIGGCRFRVSLFMKNKDLYKVTLVAVDLQEKKEYIGITTREIHELWVKENFGEPEQIEVYGYRYTLPDIEIVTEHDPRSGSDIITINYINGNT